MIRRLMDLAASRPIFAIVSLGTGAALLAAIFVSISLTIGLVVAMLIWLAAAAFILWRGSPARRSEIRRVVAAGSAAGLAATLAYDSSRWALSHLDPAPYNPFEAIRVFGVLLTSAPFDASGPTVLAVGALYHLLNGTSFGLAYALLIGGRNAGTLFAVLTGVAWGLALELFQISIYPGWLDIRAYDEFVRVSFMGHVVYGAVIGLGTRLLLRRFLPDETRTQIPGFTPTYRG